MTGLQIQRESPPSLSRSANAFAIRPPDEHLTDASSVV
jgi:hypothetical protein